MLSAVFWGFAFVLSISVLIAKELKNGILYFGLFGTITSGAYLFMGAPDVSFAMLTLGAGFTTFVFLIAISKTGLVRVKYTSTPYMIFETGEQNMSGFEHELLRRFLDEQNLKGDFIEIESEELNRSNTDIIVGGLYTKDKLKINEKKWIKIDVLETKIFNMQKEEEIDLVRLKKKILDHDIDSQDYDFLRDATYFILIEHHRPELAEDFRTFLKRIKNNGEFNELVRRYIG